jgi:uncharacterized membrane protein
MEAGTASDSRRSALGASLLVRPRFNLASLTIAYFLLINALDALTTHIGLSKVGVNEGNPLAANILSVAGEPGLYLFKTAAVATVVTFVLLLRARMPRVRFAVYIAGVLVTLVVLVNGLSIVTS